MDDATTLWELIRPELRPHLVQVNADLEKYTHTISGVLHLKQPSAQKFLCGRAFNSRYRSETRMSTVHHMLLKQRGHAMLATARARAG